ncbi:MAG: glycosyltransferase family 2 protein [Clostridiaceae bacterium]|jgi:glycosyltransferase involved in cell wall biosynthesis|nr:glycosyltransferase family 2 protein [Bacillota bacterium]NLI38532.1 glycosyltransferase family 2 protein [Clostridiaceae bacterium]
MERIVCSVIVPMYNEEAVIHETYRRLTKVMQEHGESYEIVMINDGSRDKTGEIISQLCKQDEHIKMIDFARNFGHQIAITAGMDYAAGDCMVIIDGDLQDPPELIPEMIRIWREGYEVVYGKRISRQGESFFKKFTAKCFYRILKALTDVDIPVDTGDFRLIDRKVCEALKQLPERNRYVRGLMSWVGFKQKALEFERSERFAGETKYPLKKMIKLALDGIMSFSYRPLKFATYIGSVLSIFSFLYLIAVLIQRVFWPHSTQSGWASLIGVSLFFNGIILMMLGIIGEYIGRIYDEAKGRPLYIVSRLENMEDRESPRFKL